MIRKLNRLLVALLVALWLVVAGVVVGDTSQAQTSTTTTKVYRSPLPLPWSVRRPCSKTQRTNCYHDGRGKSYSYIVREFGKSQGRILCIIYIAKSARGRDFCAVPAK